MRIRKAYLILIILLLILSGCAEKKVPPAAPEPEITAAVSLTAAPTAVPVTAAPRSTPKQTVLAVYTPTPTPSPVPTPSPTPVPFLGRWTCSFEGRDIVLSLEADGAGTITYDGQAQPFTWSYSEDMLTLTGARTIFEAVLSSDSISIGTADGTVVFYGKELP